MNGAILAKWRDWARGLHIIYQSQGQLPTIEVYLDAEVGSLGTWRDRKAKRCIDSVRDARIECRSIEIHSGTLNTGQWTAARPGGVREVWKMCTNTFGPQTTFIEITADSVGSISCASLVSWFSHMNWSMSTKIYLPDCLAASTS